MFMLFLLQKLFYATLFDKIFIFANELQACHEEHKHEKLFC
jgi:hypothetical protein